MADRDLEKTIQQLKDALPKIQQKVKKFTRIADLLEDAFVTAASKKDIYDKLMVKIAEKAEQEEALQQLTEAIIRIDKIFKGKKWTKELTVLRKSYDIARITMTNNIKKIQDIVAKAAKNKIPPTMNEVSKAMWSVLTTYIGGNISYGYDIAVTSGSTIFLHWMKVEGKVEKSSKVMYIVLSQAMNNMTKILGFLKISVFPDRIEKPPFKAGTWYLRHGKKVPKGESKDSNFSSKAISPQLSRDRVIGLFDAYGLTKLIKTRPKTNIFKATKTGLKHVLNADWVLAVNDDRKKGPVIGKSPVALFAIRMEHLEKMEDEEYTGTVSKVKFNTILKDVALLYPKGRRLKMEVEALEKIDDPTREEDYVYRLRVRFHIPGILDYKIK
jgi:hypothetical protein